MNALLIAAPRRRINAEMRSIIVVLVIIVCVAVICESASIFSHQRFIRPPPRAAEDGVRARWRPGRPKNNDRYIIPTFKRRTSEQERKQTVSVKNVNAISNNFSSKLARAVM